MKTRPMATMPTATRLALAVRYVMETDKLSIRKLAEQSGVHYAHLCNVLNCKVVSSVELWDKIALGLNTTVGELLQIDESHLGTVLANKQRDEILPKIPRGWNKIKKAEAARKTLAS
jgi:hypothetical protein